MSYVWTNERPTVPGWYWWDTTMWGHRFVKVVEVAEYNNKLYVVGFGPGLDWRGQWAGPLEEPKEAG